MPFLSQGKFANFPSSVFNSLKRRNHLLASLRGDAHKDLAQFHTSSALGPPCLFRPESAGGRASVEPKMGIKQLPTTDPQHPRYGSAEAVRRWGLRGGVDEALEREAGHNGESRRGSNVTSQPCLGVRKGVPSNAAQLEVRRTGLKAQLAALREAPGRRRKLRCTPLGSRSSRRVPLERSGREGNARRPGVWETQPLTQQQQLELAARVLLVPAKLPLDLGADALRLLLLRGQAAAAGHGARSPRRATPAALPAGPRRHPRSEGKDGGWGGDSSFGVKGRDH